MAQRTPVRLVICVDGTLCGPDGPVLSNRAHRNVTNVYRLCASIQKGLYTDSNGKSYQQEKKYFDGIASENNRTQTERVREGIFGQECLTQIREVYRECCRLDGPEDEVWLYGFSRGAWVVRAVAGLLHYIRALSATTADQGFEKEYEKALEVYRRMRAQDQTGQGQIHSMLASRTRPSPKIKFVGVFDTVKAVNDSQLFDISFNDSISHMRHALALNEDRIAMHPEYVYPTFSDNMTLPPRTFVQSWFVGAHIDIGGSSEKDGLSIYPLQWMLLESRDVGLGLEFDGSFGGRVTMDDPLKLTGVCDSDPSRTHKTTTEQNNIEVKMIDIRSIHTRDCYAIRINRTKSSVIWRRKHRSPFNPEGGLEGHCDYAPRGTIIHPSVYLVLDENMSTCQDVQKSPFWRHLEKWRLTTLGWDNIFPEIRNFGFWNKRQKVEELQDPGAIRILVCGNTGVGKSSLINKIFGVADGEEATGTSHFSSGVHNVSHEIIWPGRPDIVIHDSGGFETASTKEFAAVEEFLKDKSNAVKMDDRLHAIWLCVETNNCRPVQEATKNLFRARHQYARDVPVLVIATKKDEFEGAKQLEKRWQLKRENKPVIFDTLDEYAENELQKRLKKITEEIQKLEWGRFNACVAVSKHDNRSIEELSKINAECFSHERPRLLYIAAQIARIDLKIDLAVFQTMRIYKDVLASAASVAGVPLGSTTNRIASAIELSRIIINCFGIRSMTPEVAYEIFRSHLFDDLGGDFAILFAECMTTLGILITGLTFGMPFFLIPMASNVPFVLPAAERLILMLACDLILVFSHCFREATAKCITQPQAEDLHLSLKLYQGYCKKVHLNISENLPINNMVKFFQVGEVQEMFKETIEKFKKEMMGRPTPSTPAFRSSWNQSAPSPLVTMPSESYTSPTTDADATLGRREEGPDEADISERDDRNAVDGATKFARENGY